MAHSEEVLQILENQFELIKFYFQERVSNMPLEDSEFETISKNVFNQLSVNLRSQVSQKDFLHFCKTNKSRLLNTSFYV